jgi:hypothetical protein
MVMSPEWENLGEAGRASSDTRIAFYRDWFNSPDGIDLLAFWLHSIGNILSLRFFLRPVNLWPKPLPSDSDEVKAAKTGIKELAIRLKRFVVENAALSADVVLFYYVDVEVPSPNVYNSPSYDIGTWTWKDDHKNLQASWKLLVKNNPHYAQEHAYWKEGRIPVQTFVSKNPPLKGADASSVNAGASAGAFGTLGPGMEW